MPARELGDHQRAAAGVDREHPVPGRRRNRLERALHPVGVRVLERVGHPAARVVDEDVDRTQSFLGGIEQEAGGGLVDEVGLDGYRPASHLLDRTRHAVGVAGSGASVRLGASREVVVRLAQIGDQNRSARSSERRRGRGADPVVGAGDDRDMTVQVEVDGHAVSP